MNRLTFLLAHPFRTLANLKFRIPHTSSHKRHVFILGVPRSGTTLLKAILVSHPTLGVSDYESTGILGFRDIYEYGMGELDLSAIRQLLTTSRDIIEFYDQIVEGHLFFFGKSLTSQLTGPGSPVLSVNRGMASSHESTCPS